VSLSGLELETQSPIQWVPGDLSPGVKRPGRVADQSFPSSSEVKNTWSYTSATTYVFMAWCLVQDKENLTSTLPTHYEVLIQYTETSCHY
jgi:hypothetical protein